MYFINLPLNSSYFYLDILSDILFAKISRRKANKAQSRKKRVTYIYKNHLDKKASAGRRETSKGRNREAGKIRAIYGANDGRVVRGYGAGALSVGF